MTAIQEAVPAAAGAAQSRGGEVSNAAAAAGKRVRARKHSGASQNSWQSKLRPYLFIPDVYLEVQHPCWSCNSNSSSANASAGVR